MRALIVEDGVPKFVDRPAPPVGPDQVRVRTHAVALNNADLSTNTGDIAGVEFAGVVDAVGDNVPGNLLGNRVMGIGYGAFAEVVVTHHLQVLPVKDGLDLAAAAALPTALITEYGALRRAGLRNGDNVLITAATSGIALVGLQIARALGAAAVIGTTRTGARSGLLRRAGADHVIALDEGIGLAERVRQLTGGVGADVVLDHVGGQGIASAIEAARKGGIVVSVGRLTGPNAVVDLFQLARQQVTLRSVSYGLNPPEIIGTLMAGVSVDLLDDVHAGRISPIIDSQVPFADAAHAYLRLASGSAEGKVLLTLE